MSDTQTNTYFCMLLAMTSGQHICLPMLQRLQGEVFLFMDLCGSLLATLHL